MIRYQVEYSVRLRVTGNKFRFLPAQMFTPWLHIAHPHWPRTRRVRVPGHPRVRHPRPRDLQRKREPRSWAPRAARDPATRGGIPRNKTAEASRRRSIDGASVKSGHPWRTEATAPPLLGLLPRSPEETVPPPAVLSRCRRKRFSSFLRKSIATLIQTSKYALKMPRVSSINYLDRSHFIMLYYVVEINKDILNLSILKNCICHEVNKKIYFFYNYLYIFNNFNNSLVSKRYFVSQVFIDNSTSELPDLKTIEPW